MGQNVQEKKGKHREEKANFKKIKANVSRMTWLTVVIGTAFRGPPGLGGDSFGLSMALDSQSFFTGGGKAEPTVAIDTSPEEGKQIIMIAVEGKKEFPNDEEN